MKSAMQRLVAESLLELPEVPNGFKTLLDWASEMPELSGFRPNTARTKLGPILDGLVKDRKVERKYFYVRRGRQLRSVAHYRTL